MRTERVNKWPTSGPTPRQIYDDDDDVVPLRTGTIKPLLVIINWGHLLTIKLTAQILGTTLLLIFKHIKSWPNATIQREHWDLCTKSMWFKYIRMCATYIIANRNVPFNLTYPWMSSVCYFWNYSVFITYPHDVVVTPALWPRASYYISYASQLIGFCRMLLCETGNRLLSINDMFYFLGVFRKIPKSDYKMLHVCLSVCPYATNRLPFNRFSWNLIFQYFSQICRENSSFI